MNWNLNCHRIERLLALQSGHDLEPADELAAQRHLSVCPRCRERWRELQIAQAALELVRTTPRDPERVEGSVWPGVSRHIRYREGQRRAADWRDWLPAGALVAACLAVMVVLTSSGPAPDEVATTPVRTRQSIPVIDAAQPRNLQVDAWQEQSDTEERWPVRILLDGTDVSRL